MNRLRIPSTIVAALALAAGALVGAPAASAAEPRHVPLNGSAVPAVLGAPDGLAIAAARDDVALDPAEMVFDATAREPAITQLLVDTSALPASVAVSDLTLSYELAATPDGGTVSVDGASGDSADTPWLAGELNAADTDAVDSLVWTFDRAGTYRVRMTATGTITAGNTAATPSTVEDTSAPADADLSDEPAAAPEADAEHVTLTNEFRIDVTEPAEADAKPARAEVQPEEPSEPTPPAAGPDEASSTATSRQSASQAEGTDLAVFDAGNVSLTPLLDAARVDLAAKEFTGFELGLLDKTGEYADQRWYSVEDAIVHVSDADRDPETGLWSLPGQVDDPAAYTTGDAARLLVGVDSALAPGGINTPLATAVAISPQAQYALVDMTGPDNARLRVLNAGAALDAPTWDSSLLEGGTQPGTLAVPKGTKTRFYGWTFDAPGRYCITVSETLTTQTSKTPVAEEATYTFYIGELPEHPDVCADDVPPPPHVFDAGNVSLTPLLDSAQVDVPAKEFTGFQLGLLDKTGEYADQRWYSVEDAIIHVSDSDRDPETGLWSLPGQVDDPAAYTTGDNARLLVGVDSAMAPGGVNNALATAVAISPQAQYALVDMTGPDNGRLRVLNAGAALDAPTWDSSLLEGGTQPGTLAVPKGTKTRFYGWAFDAPGRYCVTVAETLTTQTSKTPVAEQATYTFYIGDIPQEPALCEQPDDDATNPGDDDPDDVVTVFDGVHVDVRTVLGEDGKLTLGVHGGLTGFRPSRDVVMTGMYTGTVPEPTEDADLTFIAPVGSPYWYFTEGGGTVDGKLWPGFSTENFTRSDLAPQAGISFTLVGVQGFRGAEGGKASLFTGAIGLSGGTSMLLDSRTLPMSYTINPLTHAHMNWGFDKAGQYCLNFDTRTQLADGSWATGGGQLTVWTGDPAEVDTVVPCDRLDTEPPRSSVAPTSLEQSRVRLVESNIATLTPYLDGAGLNVAGGVIDRVGSLPVDFDLNDLVLSTDDHLRDGWTFVPRPGPHHPKVGYNSDRVPWSSVDGLLDWSVGEVDGPGDFSLTIGNQVAGGYVFDTAAGVNAYELWPSISRVTPVWTFTSSGVYCVPMTWSATLAETHTRVSVTKVLTIVAGSVDPADADYIDRSTVTTCSRGQKGTAPHDDGPPDPGDNDDDLPDSDATVLDIGHVDIASQLEGGSLTTRVKDSSSGEEVVYRQLDDVVFHAAELSRTEIPAGATGAVLGQPGDPIWLLPQTQDDALLWPGWSTEEIPIDATRAGVEWALADVTGPGEFTLFQSDTFGNPIVLFSTRDGITTADSFEIPKNTHAHGSWAFSAEGTYCMAFTRSTTLPSGTSAADEFTLAVAVGAVNPQKVDPTKCFTDTDKPDTQDTVPVPDSQLTGSTAGEVQVLDSEAGFNPGQLVTTQVGTSRAGQWVSVWLHSAPTWLGWAQVTDVGSVQVRLPADAGVGGHKLVVKTDAGELLGWDSVALVAPPDNPGDEGGDDPGPSDGNPPGSDVCAGGDTTIVSAGHLDFSTQVVNGKVESLIGDNSSGTEIFREPSQTVLWLKPSSRMTLPAGYDQVGSQGSSVFLVPQTQNMDLIWLGWSTETLNASKVSSPVTWTLTDVDGPGSVKVFLQNNFGGFGQMVFDGGGSYSIRTGVHAHANWAFSKAGVYRLAFTQSATLTGGTTSTDTEIVTIVVGDVDPTTAVEGGKDCVDHKPGDDQNHGDNNGGSEGGNGGQGGKPGRAGGNANQAAQQCTASNALVISSGHLDWNAQIIGGKLESLIGDDSTGTRLFRDPASTVLWLKPASKASLPSGMGQIGTAGSTVWQVPQTQNQDLIWLGWSTELLNASNASGPVTWSLTSVDGPGSVKVYTVGTFGGVQDLVFNGTGSTSVSLGVHAHANWAFTKQGVYHLHFTQTVTLKNGQRSSDSEALTVAVGNADPKTALTSGSGCGAVSNAALNGNATLDDAKKAAEQAQATAALAAADVLPGGGGPDGGLIAALKNGNPVPLLLGILGGLLLVGAAGTGVLWRRRRANLGSPSSP